MKINTLITLLLILGISYLNAQKSIQALRTSEPIKVDGLLDEAIWAKADAATDFTTLRPVFGKQPKEKTFVKMLYDNEALYVSAVMDEVSRDSIMTELTQRDDIGNTDFFALMLDAYNTGGEGVEFIVGATGVQFDATTSRNGNEDTSWDAVWFSEVSLSDDGWIVEIKIPYSALRFPKKDVQEWLVNFSRRQQKNGVQGFWSPLNPEIAGLHTQSGQVLGIKEIKPPVRLSFSPYASAYALHHNDASASPVNSTGYSYNGGLDVKYGINDAFTLDMTLIPDFGQVESDDQVVNLSPFEVFFQEKRPFFTEGLELFDRGGIFYTRRVGGLPVNYYDVYHEVGDSEELVANPQTPQLYNATKISGRNSKGLGIGVFNAVEAATDSRILNLETKQERRVRTQPLTNYNVIVLDQNLKNNSYVSFTNTNVWRQGREFYDANVSAMELELKDKNQNFSISLEGAYAVQAYDEEADNTGYNFDVELEKISGQLKLWIGYSEESPTYNPNDLGFLRSPNERGVSWGASYSLNEGFGPFNRGNFWVNGNYNRIIQPDAFTGWWFNGGLWMQSTGFWEFNMWTNYSPTRYDFFEPRVEGRFVENPSMANIGVWVGSDNRKRFRVSGNAFTYKLSEEGRNGYELNLGPRYRFSNQFSLWTRLSYEIQNKDTGYVDLGDNDEIYFGQRRRTTVVNLVGAQYNFTEKIGLNLRLRHYWSKAVYLSFHELSQDGLLLDTDFSADRDFTFNSMNLDLNFNWRFAPGSDIFLNWKSNVVGYNDDSNTDFANVTYRSGVSEINDLPQNNSISVRIVYYLDYLSLKNRI